VLIKEKASRKIFDTGSPYGAARIQMDRRKTVDAKPDDALKVTPAPQDRNGDVARLRAWAFRDGTLVRAFAGGGRSRNRWNTWSRRRGESCFFAFQEGCDVDLTPGAGTRSLSRRNNLPGLAAHLAGEESVSETRLIRMRPHEDLRRRAQGIGRPSFKNGRKNSRRSGTAQTNGGKEAHQREKKVL